MIIMQGDSYPIYIDLVQECERLTPEMVAEMEVCVGAVLRKLHTKGEVFFEDKTKRWYIYPTQKETMELPVGDHTVIARIRYKNVGNDEVVGVNLGTIRVMDSTSEEAI